MQTLAELRAANHRREHDLIHRALKAANGSLRGAARLLKCQVSTLQRALERHPDLRAAK